MRRINELVKTISPADLKILQDAQDKLDNLTKPRGSLGKLEVLAGRICAITANLNPRLEHKVIFTVVADHGVTEEGVSAYPKEVTAQMIYNFLRGGAAINVLAEHIGARVVVVDLGAATDIKPAKGLIIKKINYGTRNMSKAAAMTKEEAAKSVTAGIEIFEKEPVDIAGIGEMGIGNTTAASAITACMTKSKVALVTGAGAGLDEQGVEHKIEVIEKSLAINNPDRSDAMDVLAKVGGFEIGGMAGIILAAASQKKPIVIDGFISASAALVACGLNPNARDYMIASHCSVEPGHRAILDYLGLDPLLDLGLRLGEGTGSALGINLAEAAIRILNQMATFKSAQVSERVTY